MYRLIALVLTTMLCVPAADVAKPSIRAATLEIPTGAMVRIKTTGKQTIHGKLVNISEEAVTLQLIENDRITERSVPFANVKSIRQTDKPMSAGKGVVIVLGVFIGLAWLIGGIAAAVD